MHTLSDEWRVNEQYSYGFFVPLLTAYLLVLRWTDRPAPAPPAGGVRFWVFPVAAALLLTPLQVVLIANPEWRAALWLYALLCYGSSLSLLGAIGGFAWLRHFAIPLSLMLFAVPWPMQLEQPLVQGLMRTVSAVTVEVLNFAGYFAEREGNLIRLSSGWIGIEEACSGVRSLQSTLMAGYFLGELFRWQGSSRLLLLLAGCTVSLLLNLGRTLTLAFLAISHGPGAVERAHDPLGHFVSLGSFLLLFLAAKTLQRRSRKAPRSGSPESGQPFTARPAHPAILPGILIAALFILQYPLAHAWYAQNEPAGTERLLVEVDWQAVAPEPEHREIDPRVRAILRYSEGEEVHFQWQQTYWTGFLFRWDPGRISSHLAVHRPEICLPAAGFEHMATGAPLSWQAHGRSIGFTASTYRFQGHRYHVFHAVWETAPGPRMPATRDWSDRLKNAWQGLRMNERQSLQMILVGPGDLAAATRQMRSFLTAALRVRTTPTQP